MRTAHFAPAPIGALPACTAIADTLAVSVADAGGKPLQDAVVERVPGKSAAPLAKDEMTDSFALHVQPAPRHSMYLRSY